MEQPNPHATPIAVNPPADPYGDPIKRAAANLSAQFEAQDVAQRARSVYIAGPMTGIPHFNRAAFEAARVYIQGTHRWAEVLTPFDNGVPILGDPDPGYPVSTYLRADIQRLLLRVGSVVLLPGWPRSRGTALELALASALSLDIYFLASDARGLVPMG